MCIKNKAYDDEVDEDGDDKQKSIK